MQPSHFVFVVVGQTLTPVLFSSTVWGIASLPPLQVGPVSINMFADSHMGKRLRCNTGPAHTDIPLYSVRFALVPVCAKTSVCLRVTPSVARPFHPAPVRSAQFGP